MRERCMQCTTRGTVTIGDSSNLGCSSYGLQAPLRMLITLCRVDVVAMISQPASVVRSVILIVMIASGAAACSSNETIPRATKSQSAPVANDSLRSAVGEQAVRIALRQVGVPYRYGGSSPRGFDCSGLVHYSYAHAGKTIPRTTAGLWAELAPVETRHIRTGDLLFFSIAGKMSHVGMYVGGGHFVHAPSTGRVVSVESLESDYYSKALIRAGRPR